MHDLAELDRRGIPACGIATEEFRDAAGSQARSLGFEPAVIFVAHPIQNRTPEELAQLARRTVDSVLAAIRSG